MVFLSSTIAVLLHIIFIAVLISFLQEELPGACDKSGFLDPYYPANCTTWILKKKEQSFCEPNAECKTVSHLLAAGICALVLLLARSMWLLLVPAKTQSGNHHDKEKGEDGKISEWDGFVDVKEGDSTRHVIINVNSVVGRRRRRVNVNI